MYEEKKLTEKVRHRINVLHVYCQLCRFTRNRKKALRLARLWGATPVYRIIYIKAEKIRRKGEQK